MANESAGVYTKIVDLGTYINAVPGTTAAICGLTKKGEDNVLKLVSSRSAFVSEFGEPNINDYGKQFGQGPLNAFQFLGESGSLYFFRALPDDAAYANIVVNVLDNSNENATLSLTSSSDVNNLNALKTIVGTETSGYPLPPTYPLCAFYPIGRGEYYNSIGIKLTTMSNSLEAGIYVLDVYEKQSDGSEVIVESFQVSFDPMAVDASGESIFVENVLNTYSSILRAEMKTVGDAWSSGYERAVKAYDKNIGIVSVTLDPTTALITDTKQDFSDWEPTTSDRDYVVIAQDNRGRVIYGWLDGASGTYNSSMAVYASPDGSVATRGWNGAFASFNSAGAITYTIRRNYVDISSAFATQNPLRNGSDGSLISLDGSVDSAEAEQLLVQAYSGTLKDPRAIDPTDPTALADLITDSENVYFNVVFDAGYPLSVKTAIVQLAQNLRKDCIAIIDNGDNSTVAKAQTARDTNTTYNTYFAALYEQYSKVYDQFTGQDLWLAPSFHMSTIIPSNDRVGALWTAPAGFNRASITGIKELRYYPKQADRDLLYLNQLNGIVKLSEGYSPWSQLTTQAKPSPMQDINIVRLVLYVEKALKDFCRNFLFEQNDEITWSRVSGQVIGFLEDVKNQRGLYGYTVEVGASDYEKKRKSFHVNVTLQPTRIVERINLNFFVE